MESEEFLSILQAEAATFTKAVATSDGDWIIKGFIDVYKKVYTISVDTKVVSKILELLLFPTFQSLADRNGMTLELSSQQNFYPDLTFTETATSSRFALDIKSTYRIDEANVNGMTLGAFTGYFRKRESSKKTLYPYGKYKGHFVLGVIYSKVDGVIYERKQYTIDDLEAIRSVIRRFHFFAQPKYRIASTRPGSGNTKNIGSITKAIDLIEGKGPFATLGEDVYDEYWMYYLTRDMAQAVGIPRPYTNLKSYLAYKTAGIETLRAHAAEIQELAEDEAPIAEASEEE